MVIMMLYYNSIGQEMSEVRPKNKFFCQKSDSKFIKIR